ncbi:glyoxylate/hydroxypyruvate reductase HPR3-like [Lolium rigidum]|uniref:glyoxylate/hydroxypyruvate reductase HPR3-like n=1 Tax=Lolium rigidum TaxID=89674 RepID=UPI001F5DD9F4|nr:glyoxylate/hydroxypyruvate reductase HPR3-like [Lolium rigidum]
MSSVLVLYRLKPDVLADLAGRFRLLDSHASPLPLDAFLPKSGDNSAAIVPGSGVVRIDAAFLDAAPSLGCIVSLNAGLNHVDIPECARSGVAIANAAGIYSADVADYVVGLLIDVLRGVSAGDRFLRRRDSDAAPEFRITTASSASQMPSSPSVLVLYRLNPAILADLAGRFRLLDYHASPLPLDAFLLAAAADDDPPRAAVVPGSGVVRIDAAFLDTVPSLGCIVSVSAGLNHVDLPECARRGVAVANAAGIYSADVADYAVGLLIDVLRGVSAGDRFLRRRGECLLPLGGSSLGGKRVGIIGLGSIGSGIARRLEAFGCVVSYHSRRQKHDVSYTYHPTILDLAAGSDVLVVACALTAETRHVVDGAVLDALGSGGVVVNVARGANVDEAELVRALAEGRIAGAGLEVFEDEPNVPAQLMGMDNVVLTHHQAAYTPEAMADLDRLVVGNLEAFFTGTPLLTPVLVFD